MSSIFVLLTPLVVPAPASATGSVTANEASSSANVWESFSVTSVRAMVPASVLVAVVTLERTGFDGGYWFRLLPVTISSLSA